MKNIVTSLRLLDARVGPPSTINNVQCTNQRYSFLFKEPQHCGSNQQSPHQASNLVSISLSINYVKIHIHHSFLF